jgi:hypothetical protein
MCPNTYKNLSAETRETKRPSLGKQASSLVLALLLLMFLGSVGASAFDASGYILDGSLPPYLAFDPTSGTISGSVNSPPACGIYSYVLTPYSALGSGTPQETTLVILPDLGPSEGGSTVPAVEGTIGNPFSLQPSFPVSLVTSYIASGLPAGLSVNNATGLISGVPTVAGTFQVTLTASNSLDSGPIAFDIAILTAQATPVITSATTAAAAVNTSFSYQITASNGPTQYYSSALPPGLSLSPTTGAITGTPTSVVNTSVSIYASNALGFGSDTLTLNFPAPPSDTPTMPAWALAALAMLLVATGLRSLPQPALSNSR